MSIRAKFKCTSKSEQEYNSVQGGSTFNIGLNPVMAPHGDVDSENAKFYKSTPGGKIELNIITPSAAEGFEVGKEYYVEFTVVQ